MLCFLGADYYAFVHRTFLEYFCAWEFVWRFEKKRSIKIEDLKTEVFGKHWQDETWHEVLLLIAGMIEAKFVGEIIDYLMAQDGESRKFANIFLAADCLAEVKNRNEINLISNQLCKRMKNLINYTYTHPKYYSDIDDVIDERDIIIDINKKAVEKFGDVWTEDPNTLPTLKQLAFNSEDIVQYFAIATVAKNFKEDSNTLRWLKNECMEDGGEINIQAVVEAVARHFKEDPETLPWLKTLASEDECDYIQCEALQALARHFKKDLFTLAFLKQRAQIDKLSSVRCQAIEELVKGWKDEPNMFDFFYNITLQDTFKRIEDKDIYQSEDIHKYFEQNPRQKALEIIIKQYLQNPMTLSLLRNRAENDPDGQVREFAQKQLAKLEA